MGPCLLRGLSSTAMEYAATDHVRPSELLGDSVIPCDSIGEDDMTEMRLNKDSQLAMKPVKNRQTNSPDVQYSMRISRSSTIRIRIQANHVNSSPRRANQKSASHQSADSHHLPLLPSKTVEGICNPIRIHSGTTPIAGSVIILPCNFPPRVINPPSNGFPSTENLSESYYCLAVHYE